MKISVSPRALNDSKFKMRKMGFIPGIIFSKTQNDPIMMSEREYTKMRRSHEPLLETEDGTLVVLKEIQKDPVSQKPIHITFQAINQNQTFTVEVPIFLDVKGTNFGSQGKSLKILKQNVKVKTTAKAMVDHLTVDVSNLPVHEVLHLKDITLPEGMELLEDEDLQLCVVNYIRVETEEEESKALSPAEVPLVQKDKPVKAKEEAEITPVVEAKKEAPQAPKKA